MPHDFRRQFKCRKFRLHYSYPDDFVLHQWQESTTVEGLFMIYRFFFLAFFTVTGYMVLRQALWEHNFVWKRTIYFSNWTLFMCWFNSLLGCILAIINYAFQYEQQTQSYLNDSPFLIKVYWVTYTIALDCSLSIAIIFWGAMLLWKAYMNMGSKIWHTIMALYMFQDFWINSIPIRILHYYLVLIYIVVYLIFNVMYQAIGGTSLEGNHFIYSSVDWNKNPIKATLYVLLAIFITILVRFMMYGLHRLKNRLSAWVFDDENSPFEGGRSFSSRDDSLSNLALWRH